MVKKCLFKVYNSYGTLCLDVFINTTKSLSAMYRWHIDDKVPGLGDLYLSDDHAKTFAARVFEGELPDIWVLNSDECTILVFPNSETWKILPVFMNRWDKPGIVKINGAEVAATHLVLGLPIDDEAAIPDFVAGMPLYEYKGSWPELEKHGIYIAADGEAGHFLFVKRREITAVPIEYIRRARKIHSVIVIPDELPEDVHWVVLTPKGGYISTRDYHLPRRLYGDGRYYFYKTQGKKVEFLFEEASGAFLRNQAILV